MSKFEIFLLHFSIVLAIVAPSYATDNTDESNNRSRFHYNYIGLGNFDYVPMDYFVDEEPISKPKALKQAYVPDSSGNPQHREAFFLHFAGQEDYSTVRIKTMLPFDQYTLREKVRFFLMSEEAPMTILSGTVTPHGILTNGHGFIEKVPSVSNSIREKIGIKTLDYRTLEPVIIEQGLTLKPFAPEDEDVYFNPYISFPSFMHSVHAAYKKEDIQSVCIHPNYLQATKNGRGWHEGELHQHADLALLKFNEGHIPAHICTVSDEPHPKDQKINVRIHQYPEGHPLQKSSEEFAHFSTKFTHQCVTLSGSSGSSLREIESNKIIGVHASSKPRKKNYFIPYSSLVAEEITFKIFTKGQNTAIVD